MRYELRTAKIYNLTEIDTSNSFDFFNGFLDENFRNHIVDICSSSDMGITMGFSEKEKQLYRYNPKALSVKLYNTPDIALILCYINNIQNFGDFDCSKPIKILTNEEIQSFISLYNDLL